MYQGLPDLAEGPQLNGKGPGGAVLVRYMEHFIGDSGGFGEKVIRLIGRQHGTGPRRVDRGIDDENRRVFP